ncbi:MAG: glycosyltransferase family 4 protein [Deltaproteobacteria bacterium]|nr:MAG: glycosyltransferase family 4 protein [Deltaproteobacteria bacterium]
MDSHSAQDKIRVLRVIGRLNVGGPSIHVVNLAAGLDPSRYEQLLVIGHESPAEGSMLDYALSRGVWPHRIQEIVTAFNLAPRDGVALKRLFSLMRLYRPHIVHTHTAKAGLLGRIAARLAGVPIIVHTFHGHVLHGYYGPVQNWALRRMEKSLAWLSHRLVTVSEQVKKELIEYGVARADRITVIPLGLDLEPYLHAETRRGEFRREMSLSSGARLVGIVGRIFPVKNHALFLESAARIAAAEPAARFVVVGDGMLRFALEQQARELGIADLVLFTGWRSDLARIYADLDVLVVSSNNEGTPLSAIEAMATSCPVVATRVGGVPDLISDYESGRLVPPRDAEALAGAVLDLLHHPEMAQAMGRNAMIAARDRFDVKRLVHDVDHLYRELLDEKAIHLEAVEHVQLRV